MERFDSEHFARVRSDRRPLSWRRSWPCWPAPAAAQDSRGSIGGRVVDSSGGVLPGVTVTIVNNGTNATTVVVTADGGVFTAPFLISGSYRVTVGAHRLSDHGARDRRRARRRSSAGGLHVEPASISTEVTVVASAPLMDSGTASHGPGDRQQADRRDAARRRHRVRPGAAGAGRVVRTLVRAPASDGQRQPARPDHQRHHQQRVHHRRLEQHRVGRARRHPAAVGFDPGVQGRDRRLRRADRPHRRGQRQSRAQERHQRLARRRVVLQPRRQPLGRALCVEAPRHRRDAARLQPLQRHAVGPDLQEPHVLHGVVREAAGQYDRNGHQLGAVGCHAPGRFLRAAGHRRADLRPATPRASSTAW